MTAHWWALAVLKVLFARRDAEQTSKHCTQKIPRGGSRWEVAENKTVTDRSLLLCPQPHFHRIHTHNRCTETKAGQWTRTHGMHAVNPTFYVALLNPIRSCILLDFNLMQVQHNNAQTVPNCAKPCWPNGCGKNWGLSKPSTWNSAFHAANTGQRQQNHNHNHTP